MLYHVTHNTTPNYRSPGYAVETVDQRADALLQLGDASAGTAKTVSKLAKLGTHSPQLGFGRWRGRAVYNEGAPRLANDDAPLSLQLPDRGLSGVQRDAVLGHERAVRGQPSSDGEPTGIDVCPEAVRHAPTRPSPPLGGQVLIHVGRAYGTSRATAPTGAEADNCARTESLSQTGSPQRLEGSSQMSIDHDQPRRGTGAFAPGARATTALAASIDDVLDAVLEQLQRRRQRAASAVEGAHRAARVAELYEQEARLWSLWFERSENRLQWRAALSAEAYARSCARGWRAQAHAYRSCNTPVELGRDGVWSR